MGSPAPRVRDEVHQAGWVDLKPTPLHTPPTSPTAAFKTLPEQPKAPSLRTDASWRAPHWAPANLVPAPAHADAAPPLPVQLEADATLAGDDWNAPFWAGKAAEASEQSRDGGWKAPRWANSPSPSTRSKERAEYVDGWRCVPRFRSLSGRALVCTSR